MAIYLDANILIPWAPLSHLERVAMSIAAQKLGQAIVIPTMAADEAEAHFVRRLRTAENDLQRAQKEFNELFDSPALVEGAPDIGGILADWRQSLIELFTVKTHPQGAAEEALRREVLRLPPARATYDPQGRESGATGARDALIWLTILNDLRERKEDGYLITANKDFIRTDQLRAELQPEVPDGVGLAAYRSAFRFLEILGAHEPGVTISLEELQRRATSTVVQLVPLTFVIPRAIFGSASNDWDYESTVEKAKPVRVKAARRWANDEEGLTVVDSEWELVVSSARFPRFSDGPAESDEDVQLRGTIQLYLLDASGEEQLAQIVSTRIARVQA